MAFDIKKDFLGDVRDLIMSGDATEHSYRPALKSLLTWVGGNAAVTNEPKRIDCGAPDFVVRSSGLVVGYVEAKDPSINLDSVENSEQLLRYRKNLENLVLTNTLEFRWYVNGEPRDRAVLASVDAKGNVKVKDAAASVKLLATFMSRSPERIASPRALAIRLARLADAIKSVIVTTYEDDAASGLLQGWRQAIAKVLIADLEEDSQTPRFADMIAQTLAYGLFTARIMDSSPGSFTRQKAQGLIPKSNPFLRQFFFQLSSPDIEDEPYAAYIHDLVTVLGQTDMAAILKNFGRSKKSLDPIVHFYETFLAAYDPELRDLRGVYYTPQPIISYLVRSANHLLVKRFGCSEGLADRSKVTVKPSAKSKKAGESHRVVILDPACGTGAFLYEVVAQIRDRFRQSNNAGLWSDYVRDHLLPRLFGFEVLVAPYAVAHFKLDLELLGLDLPEKEREDWAFSGAKTERLGIYLTNALEPPHEYTGLPLFTHWLSDESNAANAIKTDAPIMIVLGNPPYNNFGRQNVNPYISDLLSDYKKNLGERKLNLDDDYIKFIRLAQHRIQQTGHGIVGFVTNSSFATGLVHRRMRESLRETFTDIYVLNLHGNSIIGETAPGGGVDENVFDIKQGVAATLFVKVPNGKTPGRVWYSDIWGSREQKYKALGRLDVGSIKWEALKNVDQESCLGKFHFFRPTSGAGIDAYCAGVSLDDVFITKHSGIQTKRDKIFVDRSEQGLALRMKDILKAGPSPHIVEKYQLTSTSGWSPDKLKGVAFDADNVEKYAYRPFDWRHVYYDEAVLGRPRAKVSPHLRRENLALAFLRQTVDDSYRHALVSDRLTDLNYLMSHHVSDRVAPLYVYHKVGKVEEKRANLTPHVKSLVSRLYGLKMLETGRGNSQATWGPEDLFYYIYAVLWSPSFRETYDEFLKIAYPRVPLPQGSKCFFAISKLGEELAALHLLRGPATTLPAYPIPGTDVVSKIRYDVSRKRLYINATQYFDKVSPEVWAHKIGCYAVVPHWLGERKRTKLSGPEREHLRLVLSALSRIPGVLARIDKAVTTSPALL